ncbi:MAG: ATP-binding protein [Verrucomicrobia bacterium]|jgi:PAS domain S-box-containing protein|nr:ATP-binding protein [Verrucomicrobiota bacterium]
MAAVTLTVGWWAVEGAGEDARQQCMAQVSALAPTYARELTRLGHSAITLDTDPEDPRYQAMLTAEIQWQALNPHAHDIYTMRKLTDGRNVLVVDSESDYNKDGRFEGEAEQRTPIGEGYETQDPGLEAAFAGHSVFDTEVIEDPWGQWVSAFVPMRNAAGEVEAVLGVDYNAADWQGSISKARRQSMASVAMALLAVGCGGLFFSVQRADLERRVAAEARMQLTIRQMPLGFVEWNARAEVVQWNPAAERIFGHPAADVLGRAIFPLIVAPAARNQVDRLWQQLLEGKGGTYNVNENITRNGRVIICEWFNTPLIGRKGEVVAIFSLVQDITEKVRIEKHLQQTDRLNAVGELAAGVAHDFNNILTVITGHTGLLLGEDGLPEQHRFELKRISEAASRAGGLTRQLLAFSRQQAMFPKPLQVSEVIHSAAAMLSRWLGEEVTINIRIADGVPPVEADPAMLEQVITNLVLNARDALDGPGHITVALDCVVISHETVSREAEARLGPAVCLSVTDTGRGIAPEHLPRLFEPFFTTKPVGRGTGLGLSVVHGIVQQHQGWITVESKRDQGTTFKVFLPPTTRRVEGELSAASPHPPGPAHGPSKTILLAEDEEMVRELARLTLERDGFRVLEAADGLEALRIWRENRGHIDLLFTDMVMPNGMTGRQLAAELLRDQSDLPIIYASGYSLEVIAPEFVVSDRVVFLSKPYLTDQLREAARRCLEAPVPV